MPLSELTLRSIPPGEEGIKVTLNRMAVLTRQAIRSEPIIRLSRHIVQNTPVADKKAEAIAIFDWVKNNVKYVNDSLRIELLIAPERLLEIKAGDCDCLSMLIAALVESVGVPSRFVAIKTIGKKGYSHVYPEAYVSGDWLPLDTASLSPEPGKVQPSWGDSLIQPVTIDTRPAPTLTEFATGTKVIVIAGVAILALGIMWFLFGRRRSGASNA